MESKSDLEDEENLKLLNELVMNQENRIVSYNQNIL